MSVLKGQFRYDSPGVFYGTSKTKKPTSVKDNATFLETDTGLEYRYHAESEEWIPV